MNELSNQRGMSFPGFILGAGMLVFISILGMKIIPAYVENAEINHLLVTVANDVEMQKASQREIRQSLIKHAAINNIKVIKADDIEISTNAGRLVLAVSYTAKIPLVSNISLTIDFVSSSGK